MSSRRDALDELALRVDAFRLTLALVIHPEVDDLASQAAILGDLAETKADNLKLRTRLRLAVETIQHERDRNARLERLVEAQRYRLDELGEQETL